MSFQTTICNNLHTYEFYGPRVPSCPICGFIRQTDRDEYYRSWEIAPKVEPINQLLKEQIAI